MAWLGPLSERCLRLLVVAAALYVLALAAERLRVVLLAVGLAVVLAVVLRPLVRRLEARGAPAGLAASVVLLGAVVVVGGAAAATVPPTVAELGDLDVGISGGLERVQDWLADGAGLKMRASMAADSRRTVVGAAGFEPATLCSQSRCATKLRYAPA